MNIEERLDRLEAAHRALSTQHIALLTISRCMLPLIDAPEPLLKRVLLSAYDVASEKMEEAQQDDDWQEEVRGWIDTLSSGILAAANTRRQHRNPS